MQQVKPAGASFGAGKRRSDQCRLIVAPSPDPPAVQWHGGDNRILIEVLQVAAHQRGQSFGYAGPSAIFQLERDVTRDCTISDRRPHAVEVRGGAKAFPAFRRFALIISEWVSATRAGRRSEEFERGPAIEAEAVRLDDDISAGRAARRQSEVKDGGSRALSKGDGSHPVLVADDSPLHKPQMENDGPFDRRLRRLRRDRAANTGGGADYLGRLIADELLERLDLVSVTIADVLELSCGDGEISRRLIDRGLSVISADCGFAFAARNCGVQCDEDRLPFADASFDLVISAGGLDCVNDLPGALALIRRALRPNGLFLGAFAGAGSLPRLRSAMLAADTAGGAGAAPRIHPQIDVRAAGDLLLRAGFKLPVVDGHTLAIRFPGMIALVDDLRALGATNMLVSRAPSVLRSGLAAAISDFAANADPDGKTSERLEIVHLSGWAT